MIEKETVSICILCFNHANFIGKTIEGILSQVVSFEYKIYINDDASEDSTVQIIQEYQKRFPGKIELFSTNVNQGQLAGVKKLLASTKGIYTVLMDGDDYWTHNHKLQIQVNFLEENPDYIACCHDALVEKHIIPSTPIAELQSKGFYKFISQFTKYSSDQINAHELLRGEAYIQNSTLIWRSFDLTAFYNLVVGVRFNLDWYFSVILASRGKVKYINEAWSVYSDHAGGRTKNNFFHSYLPDKIKLLKTLFFVDFYNKPYYRFILYELIAREYYGMIVMQSAARKSKRFLLICAINYTRYTLLMVSSFLNYVWTYRNRFNG